MRIAICDDEENTLNYQRQMISEVCEDLKLKPQISVFRSGKDLLESPDNFEVIFLDIEMGEENGMEIAATWKNHDKCLLVFLTSHDEYMPDGYKVQAFRFLTKPLNRDKLVETISSAAEVMSSRQLELFFENETHLIYIKDIMYVETDKISKKIKIVTQEKVYFDERFLDKFEEIVSDLGFYRCHRCYIVNFSFIRKYDKTNIILNNNLKIPLSRRRTAEFVKAFDSWKWRQGSQFYV